jgi:2,3,4,5-tetrahydropyridine-2-carboxylate N-succinyltransferase
MDLREKLEEYKSLSVLPSELEEDFLEFANILLSSLNTGEIRAAYKSESGKWEANKWVKEAILILFRFGKLTDYSINQDFKYYDKNTIPLHPFHIRDNVRIVPGGTSIRNGAYIAPGVILMPPAYVNIGAYVDTGTMIDSHALVGSCAQLGKNIHLSAASQIGGVLEPANAVPVIVEDNVMIGGNCGVYEGVVVRQGAVLGSGVILTSSMKVFDLVNETILQAKDGNPLEIPENAVLVAGSRGLASNFAMENNLSLYTPIIIKYRDAKTTSKTSLTEILRLG